MAAGTRCHERMAADLAGGECLRWPPMAHLLPHLPGARRLLPRRRTIPKGREAAGRARPI